MGLENLLDYMFSSLFTKNEVAKKYIFTIVLQKDKSNHEKGDQNVDNNLYLLKLKNLRLGKNLYVRF